MSTCKLTSSILYPSDVAKIAGCRNIINCIENHTYNVNPYHADPVF